MTICGALYPCDHVYPDMWGHVGLEARHPVYPTQSGWKGDPGVPKQKLRHGDWEVWEPTDIRESSRHTWEGQGTDPRSESLGAMAPDTFSNVKAGVN